MLYVVATEFRFLADAPFAGPASEFFQGGRTIFLSVSRADCIGVFHLIAGLLAEGRMDGSKIGTSRFDYKM